MPYREKTIKELTDIGSWIAGRVGFEQARNFLHTIDEAVDMLKEQEAMVKPTKCPCGELFDAKDSSFCPRCGCAYGELSGRYTNIGR